MNRQISISAVFLLIVTLTQAQHPQKFDSLYKTLYAKELCQLLTADPSIVLLDVRTAGEFSDTSVYSSLNMGHLKGAINLQIDTMQKNMGLMDQFRDKTLVIYCSHSQRSRRVSKLLTEKGFTNFYNLNGGMSDLNQMTAAQFPCKEDWMVTSLGYRNLSNSAAASLVENDPSLVVLDVRPAIHFTGTDTAMENNIGRIRGAINTPYAGLKASMDELQQYRERPVLVYAASGDGDAARAAAYLASSGFRHVYHLLGGLNELMSSRQGKGLIESNMPFRLVNPEAALNLLKKEQGIMILDTRPATEFENRDKISWMNLGRIRNAVNVTEKDFEVVQLPASKEHPVLVYGHKESYKLAQRLGSKGYRHVYLMEGLYDFFWSSFNVAECREGRQFLVNHEGIY